MCGFKEKKVKVEIINHSSGEIELRYYDTPGVNSYLNWKLPGSVAEELMDWWRKLAINEIKEYPLKGKTKNCQIIMHTNKYVDIREIDKFGRLKMGGWSLPTIVVEELIRQGTDQIKSKPASP